MQQSLKSAQVRVTQELITIYYTPKYTIGETGSITIYDTPKYTIGETGRNQLDLRLPLSTVEYIFGRVFYRPMGLDYRIPEISTPFYQQPYVNIKSLVNMGGVSNICVVTGDYIYLMHVFTSTLS